MARADTVLLMVGMCAGVAAGAGSVSIGLAGVRIQNGLNQSRGSSPALIDAAFKYNTDFSDDTMVRGRSGLLATLYPNPTPLAQVMEALSAGSSAALHSSVLNPGGTLPFNPEPQTAGGTSVISGLTVTFSMTLGTGIDATGLASFSITNVVVSPSILVGSMEFTSGSVVVSTGCIGDFNGDGGVDGGDVEAFFVTWESGDAAADINGDGGVDGADVEAFFVRWERGC